MAYRTVGKALGRVGGPAKVSGQATYAADVLLPSMLWGKALRSLLPHARIVHIDTRAATCLALHTRQNTPPLALQTP
jgi:CO/xanthine dehydrogenase Mo-binding subunit